MKLILELFLTFSKIGLFTFGGGYAMLSLIERICVTQKEWITHDEMMRITVIAESTPGPIAINCATYIGYKKKGLPGALAATFGVVLPSFLIILLISFFLDRFLEIKWVASAFRGIKIAVGVLIVGAAANLVMNLILNGGGNSVVRVHTNGGILTEFEPIPPYRVSFIQDGYKYKVLIDGVQYDPDEVLHFVDNPDPNYPWKGRGFTVTIRDVADNLKQAQATTKGFLKSKWKPPIIVKADGLTEGFSSKSGRRKLLEEYIEMDEIGVPWIIPADHFDVKEVRPLTLKDLAISDTVTLDKKTVASIIGVPAFLLGVGEFNQKEWNTFIETTVKAIAQEIEQEYTKKVILSPKWYVRFNITSLKNWDIDTVANVFGTLYDKGIVTGNEVRDKLAMSPMEGLDELVRLENFIPVSEAGNQSKLTKED